MNPFSGKTAAEIAVYLAEKCGFSMVPLRRGTKVSQLSEWAPYQTQAADTDQIQKWSQKFPGCNWGCVAGVVSDLVVFDCDDEAAYRWAQLHLPTTPVKVKTSRGWHLYYHHPGPEYVDDLRAIDPRRDGVHAELRRDGQYAVAPGSLHENGVTIYTADVEFPGVWEYAPEFAILKPASSIDLSGLDERIADIRAKYSEVLEGNRHNTLLSYAAALIGSGCPPDRALKLTLEKNGDICTPPLKVREVVGIVGGIYKTHQRNHPLGKDASPDALATDMSGLELQPVDDEADAAFPDELLHPGGLLEAIMDYTARASARTAPEYSLPGAIAVLGTLAGQRIKAETGLTTNVYCAVLGRSASGKDAPKQAVTRLLKAVTGGDALGGMDVASDAAIINAIAQTGRHRLCFVFDELGLFLKACKNPNSPRAGIAKLLTELFSCYASPYVKTYADTDRNKVIAWQALSLLGLSVPQEFWGSIQEGETTNGFLARLLVFERTADALAPRNYTPDMTIPPELQAALSAIWEIPGGEQTPEKTPSGGVSLESMARPHVIPFADDARNLLHSIMDECDRLAFDGDDGGEEAAAATIWGRAAEHTIKIALIHAQDVRDKLIQMNRLRVMPAWRSSPKSKKTLDLFCLVAEKEGEQQND